MCSSNGVFFRDDFYFSPCERANHLNLRNLIMAELYVTIEDKFNCRKDYFLQSQDKSREFLEIKSSWIGLTVVAPLIIICVLLLRKSQTTTLIRPLFSI